MFNVKFISHFENGQEDVHGISCPHYQIYKFDNRFEVTVYPNMTMVGGVSYIVGETGYQSCYIENSAGKTVECVRGDMIHVQSLDC